MVAAQGSSQIVKLAQAMTDFGVSYTRFLHASLADDGVSFARLRLLGALACDGPQIMATLSETLQITPRAVTKLVDALEADALAIRLPHATDRRAIVVEATERGRELGANMTSKQVDVVASLFTALTEKEQEQLASILAVLSERLRDNADHRRTRSRRF